MTGQVAPHEHKEIGLVLSGAKPLASIEAAKEPISYALAISLVNAGTLRGRQLKGELAIVQPSNRSLLVEWINLLRTGVTDYGLKEYHRRIGKLYGYSPSDVEVFIQSNINCNCNKCRGTLP